jgi:hypothetical protein
MTVIHYSHTSSFLKDNTHLCDFNASGRKLRAVFPDGDWSFLNLILSLFNQKLFEGSTGPGDEVTANVGWVLEPLDNAPRRLRISVVSGMVYAESGVSRSDYVSSTVTVSSVRLFAANLMTVGSYNRVMHLITSLRL